MNNILKYIGCIRDSDAQNIIRNIPYNINTYVEPFAGSFNCGFNIMESRLLNTVVLNDLDFKVYNFWNCIKEDYDKVIDHIYKLHITILNSNDKNKSFMELSKITDDFELAAYEYLYRYNQKIGYSNNIYRISNINLKKNEFIEYSIKLMQITLHNYDYKIVLNKYDSRETLFIIDPPYNVKNIDKYYRGEVKEFNHKELKEIIDNIEGKWILRYNDEPLTRELYKNTKELFQINTCKFGKQYREIYYTNL